MKPKLGEGEPRSKRMRGRYLESPGFGPEIKMGRVRLPKIVMVGHGPIFKGSLGRLQVANSISSAWKRILEQMGGKIRGRKNQRWV